MKKTRKKELKKELKIIEIVIKNTKLFQKEISKEISRAYDDILINTMGEPMCVIRNIIYTGTNFIYRNNACKKDFLKKALAGEKPDEVLEDLIMDEIMLNSLKRTASNLNKSLKELRKRRKKLWNQIYSSK